MKNAKTETYIDISKRYYGRDIENEDELQSLIKYCEKAGYKAFKGTEGYHDVNYETGNESYITYDVLRIKWE